MLAKVYLEKLYWFMSDNFCYCHYYYVFIIKWVIPRLC